MNIKYTNALFLRVPKTASTSIISLFKNTKLVDEAQTFFKSRQNVPLYLDTYKYLNVMERSQNWFNLKENNIFTFGFVRNPWDRMVSSWKYGGPRSKWGIDFKDLCLNLEDLVPKNATAKNQKLLHISEQHPFLICEEKKIKADFIGKFENLQEDFNTVCDEIGIPQQQLPHINKSKHKHYTEYYDDETRELVAEKYAKDIENFGYKFGK
jgi:hypothetical protein